MNKNQMKTKKNIEKLIEKIKKEVLNMSNNKKENVYVTLSHKPGGVKYKFSAAVSGLLLGAVLLSSVVAPQTAKATDVSIFTSEQQTVTSVYQKSEQDVIREAKKTLDKLDSLGIQGKVSQDVLKELYNHLLELEKVVKTDSKEVKDFLATAGIYHPEKAKQIGESVGIEHMEERIYLEKQRKEKQYAHMAEFIFGTPDKPTVPESNPQAPIVSNFPDVRSNDWYYNTVTDLAKKGIIRGNEDGTYKPQNQVTYAEFLTLLNNALGTKQANHSNASAWYQNTFTELQNKGVIGNIQNPNAAINRYEMAKYLSIALEKLANKTQNTQAPNLRDYNQVPAEYRAYVANAANNGVIIGDENKDFRGTANLTRAEVAQVIKNLENVKNETVRPAEPTGKFPLPLEGTDKNGKAYKIDQRIVQSYPDNISNAAHKNTSIVNPTILNDYGQEYLDMLYNVLYNPQAKYYGEFERVSADIANEALRRDLHGNQLDRETRENGRQNYNDIDWDNLTEEELKKYE